MSEEPDPCPECGANRKVVGYRHRCVPRHIQDHVDKVLKRPEVKEVIFQDQGAVKGAKYSSRYRDPEKRKAYMREYMRKRRGKS